MNSIYDYEIVKTDSNEYVVDLLGLNYFFENETQAKKYADDLICKHQIWN